MRCLSTACVSLASLVVVAAALNSRSGETRQTSVMRRHEALAVSMDPRGALADVSTNGNTGVSTDPNDPITPCNDEYPLGKEDTSDCVEAHQDLVVDPEMCAQAARVTNAGVDKLNWILKEEWWEVHPKGCFAW